MAFETSESGGHATR